MTEWKDLRARAVASGLDESHIAEYKKRMLAEVRAYKLAELRSASGLNQTAVAERIGVSQARVSQIESGDLEHTELCTLRAFVRALGGELEVSYKIGDERFTLE